VTETVPLAPESPRFALSGVPPNHRKTRHTDQATLPSKKDEAESPAAFLGEERAFAAERGPEAPPPAPDRISGALSALPGRKEPMRQATPLSRKPGAELAAVFLREGEAAEAAAPLLKKSAERGSTPLSRKPGAESAAVFLREGEAAEAEESAGNVAMGQAQGVLAHEREARVESWESRAPGVEETVACLRERLRAARSGQDSARQREEVALEREQNRLDAE